MNIQKEIAQNEKMKADNLSQIAELKKQIKALQQANKGIDKDIEGLKSLEILLKYNN